MDERTFVRRTREIEHERDIALYDLLESNNFRRSVRTAAPTSSCSVSRTAA